MKSTALPVLTPETVAALKALLQMVESGLPTHAPAPRKTIVEIGNEWLVTKARAGASLHYLFSSRSSLRNLFSGRLERPADSVTEAELIEWSNGDSAYA